MGLLKIVCKLKYVFHVIVFVSLPQEVTDHNREVLDPALAGSGTN